VRYYNDIIKNRWIDNDLGSLAAGFRVSFFSHIVRLLGVPPVRYLIIRYITRRSGDFFSFLHYYDIRVLYTRRVAYWRCVPPPTGLHQLPAMWPLECGQRTACMCTTVRVCVRVWRVRAILMKDSRCVVLYTCDNRWRYATPFRIFAIIL